MKPLDLTSGIFHIFSFVIYTEVYGLPFVDNSVLVDYQIKQHSDVAIQQDDRQQQEIHCNKDNHPSCCGLQKGKKSISSIVNTALQHTLTSDLSFPPEEKLAFTRSIGDCKKNKIEHLDILFGSCIGGL